MMRKTRKKWLLALPLFGGLALYLYYPSAQQSGLGLPTAEVEFLDQFVDKASCVGRPKPADESYVSVQKGGRLEELRVRVGDTVTEGQILGVVDKTVNASLLKSALSNFRLAEKDFNRMARLLRSGSASREEYDRAQANFEVKRAELERAKQGVEDAMLRAPKGGRITVLVFRVGDKVPDGSRVAAIEIPGMTQIACRLPTKVANALPPQSLATWTLTDSAERQSFEAETVTEPVSHGALGESFVGMDREVRLTTADARAQEFLRRRTEVTLSLPPVAHVARIPSDAIIKRQGGFFALTKTAEGYAWSKVEVLRRDAETAYVTGVAQDRQVLRITQDLNVIEAKLAKGEAPSKDKG